MHYVGSVWNLFWSISLAEATAALIPAALSAREIDDIKYQPRFGGHHHGVGQVVVANAGTATRCEGDRYGP
jgi:hypothetical protein